MGAFAFWGVHTGQSTAAKIILGFGAPVIGFGVWGAIDFRWAGRRAEALRLTEELVISGLAALALYAAGEPSLAIALAALSLVYHARVYVSGERLLKPRRPAKSTIDAPAGKRGEALANAQRVPSATPLSSPAPPASRRRP